MGSHPPSSCFREDGTGSGKRSTMAFCRRRKSQTGLKRASTHKEPRPCYCWDFSRRGDRACAQVSGGYWGGGKGKTLYGDGDGIVYSCNYKPERVQKCGRCRCRAGLGSKEKCKDEQEEGPGTGTAKTGKCAQWRA